MEKYKPQNARIMPWSNIEERFEGLSKEGSVAEQMLALVKFIRNNGYADRLSAYTSMQKLVVTIYDPAEWNREALHIEIYHDSRQWHFQYRPKPHEPVEMERFYPEGKGIEKFVQFMEWLKW